jgi:hypothetical protein
MEVIMIREQRIMERIINELGPEFDEYIKTFYVCDLWKIKEGELIVNKTLKRVIDIIADFNLTTTDSILDNAYKLIESNEAMMHILGFLCEEFTKKGNDSLLNRSIVFCYCVFIISNHKKIRATEVLTNAIESELVRTKPHLWYSIKYKLGLRTTPYSIEADFDALALISILSGLSIKDTFENIVNHKELI